VNVSGGSSAAVSVWPRTVTAPLRLTEVPVVVVVAVKVLVEVLVKVLVEVLVNVAVETAIPEIAHPPPTPVPLLSSTIRITRS
jgi:hypothetical protein